MDRGDYMKNSIFRFAKWLQLIVGLYSFIYMPISLALILNAPSVKLPVLNFLPEYMIGRPLFATPHLDLFVLIGILFLAFIFFGAFSVGSEKVVFSVIAACYYLADLVFATLFMILEHENYSQYTLFSAYMIIPALVCDVAVLVLYAICIHRNLLGKRETQSEQKA